MILPLRIRLPGVLLVAALAAACGDRDRDDATSAGTPAAVDPAALEAPVETGPRATAPVVDAGEWAPALPEVSGEAIAATLEAAAEARDTGRLLASSADADGALGGAPSDAGSDAAADEDGDGDGEGDDVAPAAAAPGALELYLAVLAVEPGNAEALAGVEAITTELMRRGDLALVQGKVGAAQRIQRVVERALPTHALLADYRARVAAGRRAEALVRTGDERARAGRILLPEGQGAVAAYRDALKALPDFVPALDGIARMLSARLNEALAAAQSGDYAAAERLQAEAARIDAQAPALQDMAARLVELRRARTELLVAQGHAAVDALDLELAARRLQEAERVSVQAQGLDDLSQRIDLARHYGRFRPGQVFRDPLGDDGEGPEMIVLAHGAFTMGTPDDERGHEENESPAHDVTFARGLAIARAETTVAEYARFVEATGHRGVATRRGRSTIYDERAGTMAERSGVDWRRDHAGANAPPGQPVLHVAFEDAEAYAAWLSAQTGERYRLPSEAEFEYALRGGRAGPYPWGAGAPPRVVGNLTGDADRSRSGRRWSNAIEGYDDGHWGPAPVRSYPAEAFGTYDLVGNVSEWVLDCWHDSYLRAPTDGSAWINPGCEDRVVRGSSWASTLDRARSAYRQPSPAETTHALLGFRVVREL